jgi:hypothetical protein
MAKPVDSLIARWRSDIETLKRCGCNDAAIALGNYVSELEAALREGELETLTLEEAVIESGYSYSALQKQVANGTLANLGRKGAPRVRRKDLPAKAGETAWTIPVNKPALT